MATRHRVIEQIIPHYATLSNFPIPGDVIRAAVRLPHVSQADNGFDHATRNELAKLIAFSAAFATLPDYTIENINEAVHGQLPPPDDEIATDVKQSLTIYLSGIGQHNFDGPKLKEIARLRTLAAKEKRRRSQEKATAAWFRSRERASDASVDPHAELRRLDRLLSLSFLPDARHCKAVLLSLRCLNGSQLLRASEIARALNLDRSTIGRWLREDEPAVKKVRREYRRELPSPYRDVAELFVEQGMEYDRIAEHLGLSIIAVITARAQAKWLIQERIIGNSDVVY